METVPEHSGQPQPTRKSRLHTPLPQRISLRREKKTHTANSQPRKKDSLFESKRQTSTTGHRRREEGLRGVIVLKGPRRIQAKPPLRIYCLALCRS
eukprot:scaffold2441_cov121-Isochrysis_galbana.AAC.8